VKPPQTERALPPGGLAVGAEDRRQSQTFRGAWVEAMRFETGMASEAGALPLRAAVKAWALLAV